jgi:hypothetical protein
MEFSPVRFLFEFQVGFFCQIAISAQNGRPIQRKKMNESHEAFIIKRFSFSVNQGRNLPKQKMICIRLLPALCESASLRSSGVALTMFFVGCHCLLASLFGFPKDGFKGQDRIGFIP